MPRSQPVVTAEQSLMDYYVRWVDVYRDETPVRVLEHPAIGTVVPGDPLVLPDIPGVPPQLVGYGRWAGLGAKWTPEGWAIEQVAVEQFGMGPALLVPRDGQHGFAYYIEYAKAWGYYPHSYATGMSEREQMPNAERHGYQFPRVTLYDGTEAYEVHSRVLDLGEHAGSYAERHQTIYAEGREGHGYCLRSETYYDGLGVDRLLSEGVQTHEGNDYPAWMHLEFCPDCGTVTRDGERCEDCEESRRNVILCYSNRKVCSYDPDEPNAVPLMGIELEVQARDMDASECACEVLAMFPERYIVAKSDGSLDDEYGFELVTRPDSLNVHKRVWTEPLRNMAEYVKGWHGYNCGMHVHVGRKGLTELQIAKVCILVNNYPDLTELVAGRSSAQWAKVYPKSFARYQSDGRYEAVNTTGERTIEFRIFRSNVSPAGFLKNLEYVHAVVTYCGMGNASAKVTDAGLIEYVDQNRKQYPNLSEFLRSRGYEIKGRPRSLEYRDGRDDTPCCDEVDD